MNAYAANFAVSCVAEDRREVDTLQRERRLNQFFAGVEKRALRIAEISIRNRDDALDRLRDLIKQVMIVRKQRRPTKPGKAAKTRRMDSKTKRGKVKNLRGKINPD